MDPLTLLAAATPTFDGWWFGTLLSRVVHLSCAGTLLGGLIYLRFVLAPAAPEGEKEAALFAGRRKAWALCVAACSGLLLVSGTFNLIVVVMEYKNLPKLYHPLFGVKFLLALGVMAVMAIVAGKTSLAEKARNAITPWLNAALVMALGVFLLGGFLRTLRDLPDARVAAPVADEAPSFDSELIEIEVE